MPFLKYVGPHERAEVINYGHFGYGDEKQVDEVTAGGFKDERARAEGWIVRGDDEPKSMTPGDVHMKSKSTPAPAGDGDALAHFHVVDTNNPQQPVSEANKK